MTLTLVQALLVFLGVVITAIGGYAGVRFVNKSARRANNEDREAIWNAAYRNAVEPHLYYDIARAGDINQLRSVINGLQAQLDLPLTKWDPIPDPPPLFPKLEGGKPLNNPPSR